MGGTLTLVDRSIGEDDPLIGPAEVRNRFDGRWGHGFRVVAAQPGQHGRRYRVARCSDGTVLPGTLSASEVRPDVSR